MANIGENIREKRLLLKMTQEELAAKVGYKSKTTINKIEMGKNDIPQSKIKIFAEALETTPAFLMGWEKAVEEKPIETAHKLADLFIGLEFKDDNDAELISMIGEYQQLSEQKKAQVREYVHLLSGRD